MITLDTNVLIYALSRQDLTKTATAEHVMTQALRLRAPIALQVIGEFQNAARRKLTLTADELMKQGHWMLSAFDLFGATPASVLRAIQRHAAEKLSYWDAVLLASAAEAGCSTMFSEDMKGDQTYFGVRVINPFGEDGVLSAPARKLLGL